jgi:hypothetical protein
MKRVGLLSVIFLLLPYFIQAQTDSSKIFSALKGKLDYPIDNVVQIINREEELKKNPGARPYEYATFISTNCSKVKAVADGKVIRVVIIEDTTYLVVTQFDDYFLAYSNISSPIVSQGEWIKANQIIGLTAKDLEDRFLVDISLYTRRNIIDPFPWFKKRPLFTKK